MAAAGEEEVALRDGSRVLIRPVEPGDKELFARGWDRFGEESRYRRFMGAKGRLTEDHLAYSTEVDHADHEAIGARDAATREGVGGELLERLTRRARQNGIQRFQARLFAYNRGMIALFDELGELDVRHTGDGQVEIDVELPCQPASGLVAALRAAARGLVGLRP